jgi:hypothetical protein
MIEDKTIKFRGKNKQTGELVYGWGCYTDENEKYFIIINPKQFIQVEKIQRFTGFQDEFSHDIYEGDIVEVKFESDGPIRSSVEIVEIRFEYGSVLVGLGSFEDVKKLYVTGNIYKNPELLS